MTFYPILRTASAAQYPLAGSRRFRTEVLQFVDGSEQRYPLQPRSRRGWILTYSQLDEGEMQTLRNFVEGQTQSSSPFSFIEPGTQAIFPKCRLVHAELSESWAGREDGTTKVEIIEVMD